MTKPVLWVFLSGSAAMGAIALLIVSLDLKDKKSKHVVVNAADSTPLDAQFFKHIQELRQNKDKLGDFLLIRDRLSVFVQDEMTREPAAFVSLIEEAISLAPQAGPITAMNLEPFASEEVRKKIETLRKEMQTLQEETQKKVEAVRVEAGRSKVESEKEMQSLREEARVADFLKLKEQIQSMEKQVAEVKQKSLLFSSVVPVLLSNTWYGTIAVFQITNLKTKEKKIYTLAGHSIESSCQIIHILPGEYEADINNVDKTTVPIKNFFLVHTEPKMEYDNKKYHAVVETPGIPRNAR